MASTTQVLTFLGACALLKALYSVFCFISVHFLPTSRLNRFIYGTAPYALVTGASDGIGKCVAKELYARGFNLILHGRNEEKLARVRAEIQSSRATRRNVKLWVADANSPDVDFEKAVEQWDGLEITLVVNNVGSTVPKEPTIDGIEKSVLLSDIRRNALFPFLLTRALLPKLRRAAGPVELVFCGSLSSAMPTPRVIPYGATKAFLRQLSAALRSDELFRATRPANISTIYMDVGSVVSAIHKVPSSFTSPTSEDYAKHFVHCIGCGRPAIVPYWPHALQMVFVDWVPAWLLRPMLFNEMEGELICAKGD